MGCISSRMLKVGHTSTAWQGEETAHVLEQSKIPHNWNDVLSVSEMKKNCLVF